MGEDALVERLTRGLPQTARTLTGPGDDCAVLGGPGPGPGKMLQLYKTDVIVEGRHFLPDTLPAQIGWKALCRAISDIAAMGGTPAEALITLIMPPETPLARVDGIYSGLRRAARKFSVGIAGGETSSTGSGQPLVLSISLLGVVEKSHLVLRSGGKPGHRIFVTGRLGGSIRGKHLTFTPRLAESAWLVRNFRPSAMMDLSDGLGSDLPRLARASACSFAVNADAVPRTPGCSTAQAFADGEDYELLFTLPPRRATALQTAWHRQFPRLPLTCIGTLQLPGDAPGSDELLPSGWQHF